MMLFKVKVTALVAKLAEEKGTLFRFCLLIYFYRCIIDLGKYYNGGWTST